MRVSSQVRLHDTTMNDPDSLAYGERDFVGYGRIPPNPHWPNNAKVAISIVLNYEEGGETSILNGDQCAESKGTELGPGVKPLIGERNTNIESLFEYGSRAGVWRVLRLFDEYNVRCTSWAVGQALERNPEVGRYMAERGHEVASHGYRWVDRADWTAEKEYENVHKAIEAIDETAGRPPVGWYYGMTDGKAWLRSRSIVARAYKDAGFRLKYVSDNYADDLPYWTSYPGESPDQGLLVMPYSLDNNDARDNGGVNPFSTPDDFATYLIRSFEELYREGQAGQPKMMSIGLHARVIGRPARISGLRRFLEHIKGFDDVWIATREEIADHWIRTYPYEGSAKVGAAKSMVNGHAGSHSPNGVVAKYDTP